MSPEDSYIAYIRSVRRYSGRTCEIYKGVLDSFTEYCGEAPSSLNVTSLRNYEVHMMDDLGLDERTVGLHLSVLSGFSKYLVGQGMLTSNPVRLVTRPKMGKNLPVVYKADAVATYLGSTAYRVSPEWVSIIAGSPRKAAVESYRSMLRRVIVSFLHGTGMRRAELISLKRRDLDLSRKVVKVHGKGDKMREIPLVGTLCQEISLYLQATDAVVDGEVDFETPLLVLENGKPLYPVFVDRAVKEELGAAEGITGRKSPHVLRHTLATELLDGGTDLNSIKELLGHSSLAATQVYTHNTVSRLKSIYNNAHPRAKSGGKNGNQD